MRRKLLCGLVVILSASTLAFAGATITIVNGNAANVGFNDPTPAAPVGGNTGTTVGQQRLIAFQHAADIWGAELDSAVEVKVFATFESLTCTPTAAVLGSAGAIQIFANFPGAEFQNTWYHVALANKQSFVDLAPGAVSDIITSDIRARFNSNLNGNPACLGGTGWYYGLDAQHGANIDLVAVLLHEFAHGLGFSQFSSVTSGNRPLNLSDVYGRNLFDLTTNKSWDDMTPAERVASTINPRKVIFKGSRATEAVPAVLAEGTPLLRVNSPAAIAGNYEVGAAAFGPPLSGAGVTGNVVLATDAADAAGPSTTDGCSVITNASAVTGNIALVDRGTCGFIIKVKNAQDAGAIAVLVADNVAGGPPAGLGGVDPTITISSVRITLADGNLIKAQPGGGVNVSLLVDAAIRAGADPAGRALVFSPNPVQPGSSISHWDTSTFPNQLMEPSINADLTHSVKPPQDLTKPMFRDAGWYPDGDLDAVADDGNDACLGSDLRGTVIVGGTNTGVSNTFFTNGCTITDLVNKCRVGAKNHGQYVSCVNHLLDALAAQGFISKMDRDAIHKAVVKDK